MKIQSTTNYDQFKTIRGNREINKRYLKKLEKSIEENNMLMVNPIIVNEHMDILDGQHRLIACKNLGIPVYYVVAPYGSIEEIKKLNTNVRNWTMKNYLDCYISRGNDEYKKVQKFMDKTGFGIGIAITLLTGNITERGRRQTYVDDFRNGDFKATQEAYAYDFVKKLAEIEPFCKDNCNSQREFITALGFVYRKGYTHEEFMNRLAKTATRFIGMKSRKQYIRVMEDVLSYKRKVPVRLI